MKPASRCKRRFKRLGARIDEGSQTLLLVANVPDASGLLSGMSGTARFAEPK